jgi:hypothetical protein
MNLGEIEQQVASLDTDQGFDLIYDLLRAYGLPKASIARLRTGTHNRSDREGERLWRGKVYYRFVQGAGDLHDLIDDASTDPRILKERPRFLIVRDAIRLLALDTQNDDTLDTTLADLPSYFEFFLPWAGIEKTQLENVNYADVKAAEKMARLYDEIIKHNRIATPTDVHRLNVFFSRLLFCFFAEDTRVFEPGQFTNAIASMTNVNGEDVHTFLDELFAVLNTEQSARVGVPARFRGFGYVNGNLFNQQSGSPTFSAKARRVVLECGTLDWSQINPDIFGSMIQAVVHPNQRESLGMHYTSVTNIMKVIRPLFLDELHEAFESAADSPRSLQRLLSRISSIKVFDPACGSGNFLVIAYKELRKLEHRILQRLIDLDPQKGLFSLSRIMLENFYGIEIDDFAHEIAILSLWLAKHQMNIEFHELFGVEISLIPLKDTGNVVNANAARSDWQKVCPVDEGSEIYLCGNPPYQYGTKRSPEQSQDVLFALEDPATNKYLDYVAIWLYKGARYVAQAGAQLGFVATNSICQGKQVGLLWPRILDLNVEIHFAHTSFRWSNNAKSNAGVTCVVIGLAPPGRQKKRLFTGALERQVQHITPYLVAAGRDTIVYETSEPLSERAQMVFGSMPRDGGHLILSGAEKDALIKAAPEAQRFIRPYIGGAEFINGDERFCLWIRDDQAASAAAIPEIAKRLASVAAFRLNSTAVSTQAFANSPHRFVQISFRDAQAIAVPAVSSERREYIPIGFLPSGTVVSNKVYVIYGAEPWLFGLLESRMHMAWMRAVAGRLETRYSYANSLVYNTFPFPHLEASHRIALSHGALEVLDAREQSAEKTLAELYDPETMPRVLRRAHERLDEIADGLYRKSEFGSDEERLEILFDLYEKMIEPRQRALNNA